ncbi:methylenetetrahydrofolate reductase [Microbacterium sp. B2969]|uniref:Methylenetetrahydrofolate reductase n=1 Tax=Microbacterium alkaliflavum TaxID=3248839 RepID=A0ABW7QCE4_9MICO
MLKPDRVEVIPTEGIVGRAVDALAPGTTVTVTALPGYDVEATVRTALKLAEAGMRAVPHVAASRIGTAARLADMLARFDDSPVDSLFVIGGDGDAAATEFGDGSGLLRVIRERSGDRFSLGVAAYPEGHPAFDRARGLEILAAKAPLADFAVTQLCFDAWEIVRFAADVPLPLWIGVPAPVGLAKLLSIAMRIGVGPSLSFARKGANRRLLGGFDAARLRAEIVRGLGEAAVPAEGFHVYSFNALPPASRG